MTELGALTTKSEECPHAIRAFNANGEIIQMACDRWACPHCRKILAWRYAQDIRYGIALWPDHRAWFWTLTLPPWIPDAATGYTVLPQRWDNLRKTLQRRQDRFDYAAFVEAHPHRGFIPHLHCIVLQQAPARLKDLAHHAGFGYQAKEVEINGSMAGSYCAKYASKAAVDVPRHFRRVRLSHSWPRLPAPIYEVAVYPMRRGEALSAYLWRMHETLQRPVAVLRGAWLDHARDIH